MDDDQRQEARSAATVPYVATRFPPVYIRLRMDADGDDISAWLDKARTSVREALEAMDAGAPQPVHDREDERQVDPLRLEDETADAAAAVPAPPRDATGPDDEPAPAAEAASSQAGSDGASTSTNGGETMHSPAQASPIADRWTRDAIIEAIQAHVARTGLVPLGRDFSGPSTAEKPNLEIIKRAFGSWGDAVVAAGYPRPRRGGKPVAITTPGLIAADGELAALPDQPPPADEIEPMALVLREQALRDPKPNADIPYDADLLQDEAEFLRRRADALDAIATGVRQLAELTEERLAA